MADALVPYGDTRIVLRHQQNVVLYDPSSKRLVVRNLDGNIGPSACPQCGRPYHVNSFQDGPVASPDRSVGTAGPDYFRMLQRSLPDATLSAPPSPVKQLVEPLLPQPGAGSSMPEPSHGRGSEGISKSAFVPGYFEQFFHEEGELGRGGKGVVFKVSHIIDGVDLGLYACKRIPVGDDHQWLVKILAEVQLLSNLAHESLVQYKYVWLEEVKLANFGPSVPCAFILQQFCNGGDLQKHICGPKSAMSPAEELKARHRRNTQAGPDSTVNRRTLRQLSLDEIYSFFKQITAGISYLHMKNYVHRDLKPSNCLLHDTGSELRVLVSDFGEVQRGDQIREGTGATGTISYCAPEVLKLDPATGSLGAFSTKSDIFSLGMVLHFLCFGQLPYQSADGIDEDDEDVESLKDEISRWAGFGAERHIRDDLPDELYQNLSRLLSTNANHRPSAQDILQGLESLGGAVPSSQAHHSRTRSSERVLGRRSSRTSRVESQSPRTKSSAIAPAPPRHRRISRTTLSRNETAVESDEEDQRMSRSDGSLILRSRPVLPRAPPSPTNHIPKTLSPSRQLSPRLLPPVESYQPWQSRAATFLSEHAVRMVEMVVLSLKLLSLYLPCLPSAMRPIVAGPLLILAVVDFVTPRKNFWLSLTLVLIHVAVLGDVLRRQKLCLRPDMLWRERYEHVEL